MKGNQMGNHIGRRLREEALMESPQFSPLLHSRIMQRIKADHSIGKHSTNSRGSWRIGWAIPSISAAAIVLLTATLWNYNARLTKPPMRTVIVSPPPFLPKFDLHFPDLSKPLTAPLTEARFGYLDRDAKNVAHYVIDHFDVIPAPPGRRG